MLEVGFKGKYKHEAEYTYKANKESSASHSMSVFGTVINEFSNKISKLDENSVVFFVAKDNDGSFKSRSKMYQTLSKSLSKKFDLQRETLSLTGSIIFALSKKSISHQEMKRIVDLIQN